MRHRLVINSVPVTCPITGHGGGVKEEKGCAC